MSKRVCTKIFVIAFILFSLLSCNDIDATYNGTWYIENAYYNNYKLDWDFYTNCIQLFENRTCSLPIKHYSERSTPIERGIWNIEIKTDIFYLTIKTENVFFIENLK